MSTTACCCSSCWPFSILFVFSRATHTIWPADTSCPVRPCWTWSVGSRNNGKFIAAGNLLWNMIAGVSHMCKLTIVESIATFADWFPKLHASSVDLELSKLSCNFKGLAIVTVRQCFSPDATSRVWTKHGLYHRGAVGHCWALLGTVGHIVTYKALWNSSSQEIHSRLHELDADQLTSIVRPGRPVWCEIQGIWICHDLTRFDHKVRKSCAVQRPCLNSDLELIDTYCIRQGAWATSSLRFRRLTKKGSLFS